MSRRIAFVCRSLTGEALRSANAIRNLDDVTLLEICVGDSDDSEQLIDAARRLGGVNTIVTPEARWNKNSARSVCDNA